MNKKVIRGSIGHSHFQKKRKKEKKKTLNQTHLHIQPSLPPLNLTPSQDSLLKSYSTSSSLIVISIGYRLAPEHPYPAANEDCLSIGEYLIDHAVSHFGAPLTFIGGDSAGAHLAVLTTMKLLETRPDFRFKGLVLNFGCYDLSGGMPQVQHFDLPLVLDRDILEK